MGGDTTDNEGEDEFLRGSDRFTEAPGSLSASLFTLLICTNTLLKSTNCIFHQGTYELFVYEY